MGCSTGRVLEVPSLPLVEIKKAVREVLPGGKRDESENGREFFSQYFEKGNSNNIYPSLAAPDTRSYVQILILGSSRPYRVQIQVPIEQRKMWSAGESGKPTYHRIGWDEQLAQRTARELNQLLDDRRKGQNLFDEFRPF